MFVVEIKQNNPPFSRTPPPNKNVEMTVKRGWLALKRPKMKLSCHLKVSILHIFSEI